jgi:WD40 repeat protein
MSDISRGPGWWQASDGQWYGPDRHPATSLVPSPSVPTRGRRRRDRTLGLIVGITILSTGLGFGAAFSLRRATNQGAPTTPQMIPVVPSRTTPVTNPYHQAATGMHGNVLAVNGLFSKDVVPIDLSTGKVEKAILVPFAPVQVVASPYGKRAYVWGFDASIVPIDLATRRAMPPILLPSDPNDVELSPDGTWLYATIGTNTFIVINTDTAKIVSTVNITQGVGAIVVSRDGRTAYIDSSGLTVQQSPGLYVGGNTVTSFNLETLTVDRTFVLPSATTVLGISPNDAILYVETSPDTASGPSSYLYEIDVGSGALGVPKPFTDAVNDFALAPSGRTAYISSGNQTITPLDLSTLDVGKPIKVGENVASMVFSNDGRYMAVGTSHGVVVVDLVTGRTSSPIPLPSEGSTPEARIGSSGAIGLALVPRS